MGFKNDIVKILGLMSENISGIRNQGEFIMADLTALQNADTDLQASVATVLTDFATAVANADNPGQVAQVVSDMRQMAANIASADPNAPQPPVTG